MHGAFSVADRQKIIDEFRTSTTKRVLISSDVGAEGLDFQFCNTLFNYDLPWNPMKVEQRIGRIDRFGQEATKIRIYNLVIEGTIESRILMRLYERIGLFEQAIGDIEAILGEEVRDLSWRVYTQQLTERQERELAEQAALNILRRKQEMEEFEEKRLQFMGQEAIFSQLVHETIDSGAFVSEAEIASLVRTFVETGFKSSRLVPDEENDGSYALELGDDLAFHLRKLLQKTSDLSPQEYLKVYHAGRTIPLTFSSQLAFERKLLQFVNLRHPLTQAAFEYWQGQATVSAEAFERVTFVTEEVPGGNYLLFVFGLDARGIERSTRLVPVVIEPQSMDVVQQLSARFLRLAQTSASESRPPFLDVKETVLREARETAMFHMVSRRDAIEREVQKANEAIVNARLSALEQTYLAKSERVERRLAQAKDARIRRMHEGELRNLKGRYELMRGEVEQQRTVSVGFALTLTGVLTVLAPSS
jgi:hypothetical protein